jgi:hypothetical protein
VRFLIKTLKQSTLPAHTHIVAWVGIYRLHHTFYALCHIPVQQCLWGGGLEDRGDKYIHKFRAGNNKGKMTREKCKKDTP